MLNTLWAIVHGEKIELLEKIDIPEGTKVLVTILPKEHEPIWRIRTNFNYLTSVIR